MSTEIASLFVKIGADTKGFSRGMGLVNVGMKTLAVAGVAAVVGVGAAIGASIKRAASMEQALADINAVMGLTSKEVVQLKGLVRDLGLDPTLQVSAVGAAQAIEMLGKNGLTMTEIMEGAARSTVLLANSTGADFATAADVATDVMAQFNIEAADMGRAVDGITGVTKTSKFDINDYRLAIAQAGGVAGAVGVSFEDFNTVISGTAASFGSGSDAGTSFKVFLQRMVPQTKKATKAMQELGIITEDGQNRFFDASGQMKDMSFVSDILGDAFSNLSEEQMIEAASTIFGTDAMRTAMGIAQLAGGEFNKLKGIIGDTDAEEAAAIKMNTLAGQWEIFTGKVEAASQAIGGAFLPVARKMLDWANELADEWGPLVIAWAENFGVALETLWDKMAAGEEISGAVKKFMVDAFGDNVVVTAINDIIDIVGYLYKAFKNMFVEQEWW